MAAGEIPEKENSTQKAVKELTVDDIAESIKLEAEEIKNAANELFKGDDITTLVSYITSLTKNVHKNH